MSYYQRERLRQELRGWYTDKSIEHIIECVERVIDNPITKVGDMIVYELVPNAD